MDEYLQHTKVAFNKAAINYDSNDSQNPILKWMRDIVHLIYFKYLTIGNNVLELNSGTGIDAVFLANKGINVFATDVSDNMISILKEKVINLKLEDKITAERYPFSEINKINNNNFDSVISNFGGLNCINNFLNLNNDINNKLKQGGYFIAVVMNKFCPWEIFFYCLKFDFKNAFRRFKNEGIDVFIDGEKVKTFYYTPNRFGKFFCTNFKIIKTYSLGLLTPPPYLGGIYIKLRPLVKLLMKFDNLIKGIPLINLFGDHFIIIMKKK